MGYALWESLPALRDELEALEALLAEEFGGTGVIQSAASKLVLGGGKRLRPALTIASALTGRYDRAAVLPVAAALETLHAATLVHDDVIDGAEKRRGMPTLHERHGNHTAIYMGDWLLAKAVLMLSRARLNDLDLKRLAMAMEALCAGEVSQYLGRGRVPGTREYLKRIMGKTGVLFAAACASGGRQSGLPEREVSLLWRFGMRFGTAFQIRDDLLDLTGEDAGKPAGRDLMSGVVTLPVLLAAEDSLFRARLDGFLAEGRPAPALPALLDAARSLGAEERTRRIFAEEVEKAAALLGKLPDNAGTQALRALALAL